jgi:hypothetical protein
MKIFGQSIIVGALLCSTSAYANPPAWTISESSGQVNVLRPGITEVGTRGKALKAGDVIATGKAGRAVLVRGGEYLVISANSRIAIAQPKEGSMTQIVQSFGNAVFKIQKKTTPHFAVQTPYLAAVVKGTTFSVTVEEGGASVQVTEGRVQVSTTDGGASHLVIPGEIGLVRSGMPGRLSVKGDQNVDIDSPTPPPVTAPASPVANDMVQAGDEGSEPASGEKTVVAKIEEAIGEGAVDLGRMSDGMVTGNSTLVAMVTRSVPEQRPSMSDVPDRAPEPKPALEVVPTPVVDQLPAAPVPDEVVDSLPPVEVTDVILPPAPAELAEVEVPCNCGDENVPSVEGAPADKEVEVAALDPDGDDKSHGKHKFKDKDDDDDKGHGKGKFKDKDDNGKGHGKHKFKDKDDDDNKGHGKGKNNDDNDGDDKDV